MANTSQNYPEHTEIVVIGAGPGGYPAAFEAADHAKASCPH